MSQSDTDLLDELKDRYTYGSTEWQPIREEGSKDMRYIAGGPWEAADKKSRVDAGRPCLTSDELGQYVNQVINDLRANKRGIKVSPVGNGANDKTARFRQGKIRDIEYRSNAQQAYTTLGENAIQRSYGYLRIKAKYVNPNSGFDQEPVIEPVVNPDTITADPDFLRTDGADWNWLFVEESRAEREFSKQWPDATVKSFSAMAKQAPGWVKGTKIRVAEYWTRELDRKRTLVLLKPTRAGGQPREVFLDELKKTAKDLSDLILKQRKIDVMKVCQYITNGLEILETNPWPGHSLPFVSCYGKVLYLDEGDGPKRKILSMIRLARDPYMLYCYYRTQQAEMAGMIPKVPVIGYKGQFAGLEADWQRAPHEPMAFIEANAKTKATGDQLLPLPTRLAYEAGSHLQALELCAEGARRAIQAAMGVSPLPTQALRHNEKSGVALKQIEDSGQKGSFHFIDHYDEGITRTGAILDELVPYYFDTARETSIRKPDDTVEIVRINDRHWIPDQKTGKKEHIPTNLGTHDVTISVGPAMESERDAASQFADTIVGSKELLMVAGQQKAVKLLAAAIRLKNVGPIGDEMADIIDPKDDQQDNPQRAKAQIAQMQQELQDMGQALQQAAEEVKGKKLELASKEKVAGWEIKSKETIAKAELDAKAADRELKLAVVELTAKVERMALFFEERARVGTQQHDAAHDVGMAALEHEQAQTLAAQQGAQQAALGAQGHQRALEAGEQGHDQSLEQATLAASLAPAPETGAEA